MGLHLGQMTGIEEMKSCFRAVTEYPAKTMGLEGYGLEKGCNADMLILQAADPIEALRLKPTRLFVIRRGKIIARSQPLQSELDLPGRPKLVNFQKL